MLSSTISKQMSLGRSIGEAGNQIMLCIGGCILCGLLYREIAIMGKVCRFGLGSFIVISWSIIAIRMICMFCMVLQRTTDVASAVVLIISIGCMVTSIVFMLQLARDIILRR